MKPLFDYLDYQLFLRDYYDEMKKNNSFFSYRYMGMKIGLDAGYLVKVLQGKVNLSNKSIPRIIEFLKLKDKEAQYFEALINFGKAKTEKDNRLYFNLLQKIRGVNLKRVTDRQFEFYKKWYHNAIRSLLAYYPFSGNYKELAKMLYPTISVKEAKDSIDLLTSLKLIEKNEKGIFKQTQNGITTGDKWRSAAIHNFQQETISLAKESLDNIKKDLRDISSMTISANHNDILQLRELAREFRNAIHQMKTGNSKADTVFQINIQILPLTEVHNADE